MKYWNDILMERSWNTLMELKKTDIRFVLIGGWATYLWTKQLKSRDIDIVLNEISELEYLKKNYILKKNDRLRKYEIKLGEVDVDIYVPHYSRLSIPPSEILLYTNSIEGFDVPTPEVLLILKQGAEVERGKSVKGEKDRIDIMSLLFHSGMDFDNYRELLKKYDVVEYLKRLRTVIKTFDEIGYLNMNPREFKLKKQEVLKKLR